MSDNNKVEASAEIDAPVETTETTDPAPAQDTDWVKEARKWESLAKKNLAEAKANAEAAKKLAEIEESSKSEVEKAQERLEEAERRALELEFQVNRATVANQYKVPMDLLAGPKSASPEDIEEFAQLLIGFKGEKEPNPVVSAEGKTPATALNGGGIEDALRNALGVR